MSAMEFASYLFTLRTARKPKLTQKVLGEAIGVTDTAIRQWEQGEYVPGFDHVAKLLRELGGRLEDVDWLLNDAEGEHEAGRRLALDRLNQGDGKLLAAVMARRLEQSGVIDELRSEEDAADLLRLIAQEVAPLLPQQRRAILVGVQGYISGRLAARGETDQPPDQPSSRQR